MYFGFFLIDLVFKNILYLKWVLFVSEFKKIKICEDGDYFKIKYVGENSN